MKNSRFLTKLLAGFFAASMILSAPVMAAETESSTEAEVYDPANVNIVALKGPTAMGLVKFMSDAGSGALSDYPYEFHIAAAVDEVGPKLIQGQADIAAVPANLASVLYNKTEGQVEVLAVNTLGVLYIVERGDSISSVDDLKGRTLYASGKGASPEFALDYILRGNGLDPDSDVKVEWKSEHTECLSALMADESGIALLPQPFVTVAQTKDPSIRVALDLTDEWDALQKGQEDPSSMITGVVVARKDFIEEDPERIDAFLSHYQESVDFVNENVSDAASLVGSYDIVPAPIAEKAIPECNIVCYRGDEMKTHLSGYLKVLFDAEPKSVGGALPADDFYYIAG